MEKNLKRIYVQLNRSAVYLKLIQHGKLTIPQFKQKKKRKKEQNKCWQDWRNGNPQTLPVGAENSTAVVENRLFCKIKRALPDEPSNLLTFLLVFPGNPS